VCVKQNRRNSKGMSFYYFGWILLYCRGREIVWIFRIGLNLWFNDAKWPWIMLFMHENKLEVENGWKGFPRDEKSSLSKILAIKEGLLWLLILSLKTK